MTHLTESVCAKDFPKDFKLLEFPIDELGPRFDLIYYGVNDMTDNTLPNHETGTNGRNCETCACSFIGKHPQLFGQEQMFCRRNPPLHARVRVQRPRLGLDKKIMAGRDGKPIMETAEEDMYLYVPTTKTMVCFDGWRPVSTLPGDKFQGQKFEEMSAELMKSMTNMVRGMELAAANAIADLSKDVDGGSGTH